MNNCSKHKKEILGISNMNLLGEMIGDLHYQALSELLMSLASKISSDAENDKQKGREKLANELFKCADSVFTAEQKMLNAWYICKPYMEVEK